MRGRERDRERRRWNERGREIDGAEQQKAWRVCSPRSRGIRSPQPRANATGSLAGIGYRTVAGRKGKRDGGARVDGQEKGKEHEITTVATRAEGFRSRERAGIPPQSSSRRTSREAGGGGGERDRTGGWPPRKRWAKFLRQSVSTTERRKFKGVTETLRAVRPKGCRRRGKKRMQD